MMNETENKPEIINEFLNLVIEMRKAQAAIKFGRKPSMYDRRDAAEKGHIKVKYPNGSFVYVKVSDKAIGSNNPWSKV